MRRSDDGHIDDRYADLADLILAIARTVSADAQADPRIVDLTPTEVNVMRFVDRNPGTSPSAVAAATGLQRSNLSRAVRDLEAKGMIARSADATDGRQSRLTPTERAATNLARLRSGWSQRLAAAGADTRHLDATLALLAELDDGLQRRV